MQRFFTFLFISLCFNFTVFGQTLQVEDSESAGIPVEQFISEILLNSNFEVLNVTYEGSPVAVGEFTSVGGSPVGIEHGMVLTTGRASSTNTTPGSDNLGNSFASTSNGGTVSNSDLESLSSGILNDVANVIIEIRPYTDTLVLDFVFGSEEYPEYACSAFNDIFGLFLSGPEINGSFSNNGINIARVPNTDLPLSINTIHPDNGTECLAFNEEYYIDNDASSNQPAYDGYTTVIPIRQEVIPFETYTLTLSVADLADNVFDTGTFMQFGDCESEMCGFFNDQHRVIEEGCAGKNVHLDLSDINTAVFPLEVEISGTAENGVDYESVASSFSLDTNNPVLDFDINPIMDNENESPESVKLTFMRNGEAVKTISYYLYDEVSVSIEAIGTCDSLQGIQLVSETEEYAFSYIGDTVTISPVAQGLNIPIDVSGVPYETLFSTGLIKEVCINLTHNWLDDIDINLVSPSGQSILLTSDNGANGDDYLETCFSPLAIENIRGDGLSSPAADAPFTGSYQAEGYWDNLLNSEVNGTWHLRVKDDAFGFTGTLDNWRIVFDESFIQNENVSWSNGQTGVSIDLSTGFLSEISATIEGVVCYPELNVTINNLGSPETFIEGTYCNDFSVEVNNILYNIDNPVGVETFEIENTFGCDSIVYINLNFEEELTDIIITEDFILGAEITIGDTLITEEGFHTISMFDEISGCTQTTYLSFIPPSPNLSAIIPSNISSLITDCEGTDYCLDLKPYPHEQNLEILIDEQSVTTYENASHCSELEERIFTLGTNFNSAQNALILTEVAGQNLDNAFPFITGEELVQHLNYIFPQGEFYEMNNAVGEEFRFATRTMTDIEFITILNQNLIETQTFTGETVISETGIELNLELTAAELSIHNQDTNETQVANLDLETDIVTENEDYSFYMWNDIVQGLQYIYEPIFVDELCGDIVSIENLCPELTSDSFNIVSYSQNMIEATDFLGEAAFNTTNTTFTACLLVCDSYNICDTVTITNHIALTNTKEIQNLSQTISMYPNPSSSTVHLSAREADVEIKSIDVFTVNGQNVKTSYFDAKEVELRIDELPVGVYWLKIDTEEGIARKKLVVMR